jgi:hypothetical protein
MRIASWREPSLENQSVFLKPFLNDLTELRNVQRSEIWRIMVRSAKYTFIPEKCSTKNTSFKQSF